MITIQATKQTSRQTDKQATETDYPQSKLIHV